MPTNPDTALKQHSAGNVALAIGLTFLPFKDAYGKEDPSRVAVRSAIYRQPTLISFMDTMGLKPLSIPGYKTADNGIVLGSAYAWAFFDRAAFESCKVQGAIMMALVEATRRAQILAGLKHDKVKAEATLKTAEERLATVKAALAKVEAGDFSAYEYKDEDGEDEDNEPEDEDGDEENED